MKILVTGGCGFIGHNLVKKLKSLGHFVYVIDNLSNSSQPNFGDVLFETDIANYDELTKIFKQMGKVDCVFHLASLARVQPSIKEPSKFNEVNVTGTVNLLDMCRIYGIERFIFSSSSSVYGDDELPFVETSKNLNPKSPYGLQKLIGEQYCKIYSELYNIKTFCLRYFNVYGDTMPLDGQYITALSIFKKNFLIGNPIPVTNDGEQSRDFTHVNDVVNANVECLSLKSNFEIFNVGNGIDYKINDICKLINSELEYIGNVVEPKKTLSNSEKLKSMSNWKPTGDLEKFIKNFFKK